jgi:uncharacterized protein YqjF (DUF2071 family)
MRQTWHDLLFAHWPIPIETMRPLIPPQLALDIYDGMAWIAVVPFRMSGVVPRGLPDIPWLSAFPELNVRTYVTTPAPAGAEPALSKPGVYFFSLEAANPIAVTIARQIFKLLYFNAKMSLSYGGDLTKDIHIITIDYVSHRTHRGARPADFEGSYGPTGSVYYSQRGTLESWMTERYCLYTTSHEQLYRGEIHHLPWPLQPATATISVNSMTEAAGITLPAEPPILHISRRLDVIVWPLRFVK